MSAESQLDAWLSELDERNRDNRTRTASYLELYSWTLEAGRELPWLLMAHLVSRNAGYLMTDLATAIERGDTVFGKPALEEMFLFLERANWLIFWDAWYHVLHHLSGKTQSLGGRVAPFDKGAWLRYEVEADAGVSRGLERRMVLDLVQNEQELLEEHVIHAPQFARTRAMIGFFEATRSERPIALPLTEAKITVGNFLSLERRVAAGRRIFDEVLASEEDRAAIHRWAKQRPHTGSRAVAGGRETPTIVEAWPISRVLSLWNAVHRPPSAMDDAQDANGIDSPLR